MQLEKVSEDLKGCKECIKDLKAVVTTSNQMISKFQDRQTQQAEKELQRKRKADNALFKGVNRDTNKMMEKERSKAKCAATTGLKRTKTVRAVIVPRAHCRCLATHHTNGPSSSG
jgi:predicted Rossmann fold nucleotide-binding protein DprA/Smf involved in DNA uptake